MNAVAEYRFWSVLDDCEMARVSVFERGREFFAMVTGGAGYRGRRDAAVEMIGEAIAAGLEPGEVLPA